MRTVPGLPQERYPNMGAVMERLFEVYADRPMLGTRNPETGEFDWISYAQVGERVQRFQGALWAAGARPLDIAGICASNSVGWYVGDWACVTSHVVVAPLHTSLSQEALSETFRRLELTVVLTSPDTHAKVAAAAASAPSVRAVVPLDAETSARRPANWLEGVQPPGPGDLNSVMLTSGTTGAAPKGIPRYQQRCIDRLLRYTGGPDTMLCFAPLSHSERDYNLVTFAGGGRIGLHSGDMATLFSDFQALRPDNVFAVPRIFNVVYQGFLSSEKAQGFEATAALLPPPARRDEALLERLRAAEGDRDARRAVLLEAWRTVFGGRVKLLKASSAAISPTVSRFLLDCFGLHVRDGYATQEVDTISVDGVVRDGVEVQLRPCEGFPFPQQGELLVRTPEQPQGYFRDPEATAERFTPDGFFITGDVAEVLPDGRYRIFGRAKHTTKLSQGEWVNLDKLDETLAVSAYVQQLFVHGSSSRPFLVAVAVPSEALLRVEEDAREAVLLADLQRIAEARGLRAIETPRAVLLSAEPFTVANGLLTPSDKLRRLALAEHFAPELERLLEGVGGPALDSLAAVRLHALVEEELGTKVSLQSLLSSSSLLPFDPDFETALPAGLTVPGPPPVPTPPEAPTAFVTGATGFVGVVLLWELLQTTALNVWCLVRGGDPDRLWRNLRKAMPRTAAAAAQVDEWRAADRVRVFDGDLGAPRLGLSPEDYAAVAEGAHSLIHNGALVNMVRPYADQRGPNVLGTQSMVELACAWPAGGVKPLHHVSTVSAFNGPTREDTELSPEVQQLERLNGYGQSKWVAERMLVRAREAGVPVTVYRLGSVVGHSQTGFQAPEEFFGRLLLGLHQLGRYPVVGGEQRLLVTPVDHVARTLVRSLGPGPPPRPVVHLFSHHEGLTVAELATALGLPASAAMPLDEWVALLRASPHCALFGLQYLFGPTRFPGSGRAWEFDDVTQGACPEVDVAAIWGYLSRLGERPGGV